MTIAGRVATQMIMLQISVTNAHKNAVKIIISCSVVYCIRNLIASLIYKHTCYMSSHININKENAQSFDIDSNMLQFAVQAAGSGIWELRFGDPVTMVWDEQCKKLHSIPKHSNITYTDFLELVHQDDRNTLMAAVNKALDESGDGKYDMLYRITNADGHIQWIRSIGQARPGTESSPGRLTGILRDITKDIKEREEARIAQRNEEEKSRALKATEGHFRTIVEQAPVAIALLHSRDMVVKTANKQILEAWGKDERIIGMPLIEAVPELLGQLFMALLEDVYDNDAPHYAYAMPAKLLRNGKLEDVYSDFVYTPMRDAEGSVTGVMVLATIVTQQVMAQKALEENAQNLRNVIEQAPVAMTLFRGPQFVVEITNSRNLAHWGRTKEEALGRPVFDVLPEIKGHGFEELLRNVYETGETYSAYGTPVTIEKNGRLETTYVSFVYEPFFEADGSISGIMSIASEVTEELRTRKKLEESEERLRSIVESAPFPIGVYTGPEMRILLANQNMLDVWGKGADVTGKTYPEVLPELDDKIVGQVAEVYRTGVAYHGKNTRVDLLVNGRMKAYYFNYSFTPVLDNNGNVYGVMNTAADVTELNLAKKELEDSEARFRSLIMEAPVATCLFVGKELTVEVANDAMLATWGKNKSIIGKPLEEALPEAKGQPFMQLLDDMLVTGKAYSSTAYPADLEVNGVISTYYFNFTYKPLFDSEGEVYAIMNMAVDVTDQVIARRKIEEAEASLRGAVELAELGTWSLDLNTRILDYSPRMRSWFGYEDEEVITIENGYSAIAQSDHHLIRESMTKAIDPAIRSGYDVEYTTINKLTGRQMIVHAQGKAIFNDRNEPITVTGTAQDVTEQRKVQLALEHEVQLRTEELAASNEEMAAINEELNETNERLMHSNEELAQYAYVASHDLQEPLRKIQVFSDILESRGDLKDGDKVLLKKIGQSSVRMTMLIKDLLNFSRLLQSDAMMQPVNLAAVIDAVVNDFELTIVEQKAVIEIGDMPVIEAIQLQMNQLFYNLLSNALKFIDAGKTPHITISTHPVTAEEAKRYIPKIIAATTYYKIAVADNGIGFEDKYSDQIFEVFKRLHTKEVFAGSGVGLALCRRIVDNHSGHIFVESAPGVGTTFYIILPAKQVDKVI